jgi:hypothetical protein
MNESAATDGSTKRTIIKKKNGHDFKRKNALSPNSPSQIIC